MADPEIRPAAAGQTISVAGAVVHTLAPGDTLVQLPGADILYRVPGGVATPTPVPVPTPTPTPTPTPARVTRFVVNPDAAGRQIGRNAVGLAADPNVRDVHYEGYPTNVNVEHCPSLTVRNLRSVRAWRLPVVLDGRGRVADNRQYQGQGIYVDAVPGGIAVSASLLGWNGWQRGRAVADRTQYRHGAYNNFGAADPVYEDCVFVGNPACGAQCRGGGRFRRCVFLDNGVGLLASMGRVTLDDCLIYGGTYYAVTDAKGLAWTGMVGVAVYATLSMSGTAVVGRPGQAAGDAAVKASGSNRLYPGPALQLNRQAADAAHPQWRPPPGGPSLSAADCVVSGWPAAPFGGSGWPADRDKRPVPPAGVRVAGAAVDYDYAPVLVDVMAERLGVADAAAKIRADVRRMAGV